MTVDWQAVQRALYPMKDYEDLCRRFRESCAYEFVRQAFNFSLSELDQYTRRLLGGDLDQRYGDYVAHLTNILGELQQAGVMDVLELVSRTATRQQLEVFTSQSGVYAQDVASLEKYLVYWVIPMEKRLSGLIRSNPLSSGELQALSQAGVRTNLQLLQAGRLALGRQRLAEASGLPAAVVLEWVQRADLSRLPWASKATISNILGAGYGSLRRLANADPQQVAADFYAYGESIGKNLKYGNEIENVQRIARLVPALVEE